MDHAEKALNAARQMSHSANIVDENGEAIPAGIGVHTGKVLLARSKPQEGLFRDVSIFGQNVNSSARLTSTAKTSEALVSEATIQAAGNNNATSLENRTINLKDISDPVTAFVIAKGDHATPTAVPLERAFCERSHNTWSRKWTQMKLTCLFAG